MTAKEQLRSERGERNKNLLMSQQELKDLLVAVLEWLLQDRQRSRQASMFFQMKLVLLVGLRTESIQTPETRREEKGDEIWYRRIRTSSFCFNCWMLFSWSLPLRMKSKGRGEKRDKDRQRWRVRVKDFRRSFSWIGSSFEMITGLMRREEEGMVGVKYF
jgi:hypothetical protein